MIMKQENKEISISFAAIVNSDLEHEEIADRISDAIKPLADNVKNVSDIAVRTVPRFFTDVQDDFQNRLWEKATCNYRIQDPLSEVSNPQHEMGQIIKNINVLSKQFKDLQSQLQTIQEQVNKI